MKLKLLFGFVLVLCGNSIAQEITYFGVGQAGWGAFPFYGYYDGQKFVKQELNYQSDSLEKDLSIFLDNFLKNKQFTILDSKGRYSNFKTLEIYSEIEYYLNDLYEPLFRIEILDSSSVNEYFMFWTTDLNIAYIKPDTLNYSNDVDLILRNEIEKLWKDALGEVSEENTNLSLLIGKPKIYRINESGIKDVLIAEYPCSTKYSYNSIDERGSAFILYSLDTHRIIYSIYGHPEWEFNRERVRTIDPLFFFKLENNSNIYFVADNSGPWEDLSYAIFRLNDFKLILKGY